MVSLHRFGRYIIALGIFQSIVLQYYSDAKQDTYVKLQSSHYSFPSMPFAKYRFVASLSRRRRLKSWRDKSMGPGLPGSFHVLSTWDLDQAFMYWPVLTKIRRRISFFALQEALEEPYMLHLLGRVITNSYYHTSDAHERESHIENHHSKQNPQVTTLSI